MTRCGLALGIFLTVAGIYLATGSGRIDSIDGQIRFEASAALLDLGRLQIRDPAVRFAGVRGVDGKLYTPYGPAPSIVAAPLVAASRLSDDRRGELHRFLFSLTNGVFGAGTAAVLFAFLVELGLAPRRAVVWSLASAFGTYLWPGAETVLEQGQHAFWALLAVWLGYLSSRRDSLALALTGGIAAGTLVLYQIPYAMHLPILALSACGDAESATARTTARGRFTVFLAAAGIGLAVLFAYRLAVFGALSPPPPSDYPVPPLVGNPLAGIPGLLLSPGKGVFFYSPALALAVVGVRRLGVRAPRLVRTLYWLTAFHLLFIGSLSIWHSEWCWGPRYLLVLMPLWCLAMPFAISGERSRRLAAGLLVAGLAVNLLGLSVVHERFYFERGLPTYFWYHNNGFFWRNSALLARVGEVSAMRTWDAAEARGFSPAVYRGLLTYTISPAGPLQPAPPPWLRDFMVFNVPRPWPLWVAAAKQRGIEVPLPATGLLLGLGAASLLGASLLIFGLREGSAPGGGND
jgi:hypothetical protein